MRIHWATNRILIDIVIYIYIKYQLSWFVYSQQKISHMHSFILWHISATTCQIIMSTSQIFMSSYQIYMLICQIFILTCHLLNCWRIDFLYKKYVLAQFMPYRQKQNYMTSRHNSWQINRKNGRLSRHQDLTSRHHYLISWHNIWQVDIIIWKDDFGNYVDLSNNYNIMSTWQKIMSTG